MSRPIARIVLGLAVATAAAACDKKDAPVAPTEAKPIESKPAELAKPDFTLTARDVYAEFRPQIEAGTADAVRAKYTGKVVRITGDVKANADMMGTWELTLVANDQTGQAFLHPSAAGAADVKALKPGDKVTLQCVSEGWEIGPQFKGCVVIK
jgi:hypothetical protein